MPYSVDQLDIAAGEDRFGTPSHPSYSGRIVSISTGAAFFLAVAGSLLVAPALWGPKDGASSSSHATCSSGKPANILGLCLR